MAFPFLTRRRELAVKAETTKGTFNAPAVDGTESKFLIVNPNLASEFGVFDREIVRDSLSRLPHIIVNKPCRLTFSLEVRRTNKGTATPDVWGLLLQGCGFEETAGSSEVIYTPTSVIATQKSLSMYYWIDGIRIGLRGCMGNVEFVGQVGNPMLMNFDFIGLFQDVNDDSVNTVSHESAVPSAFQGVNFAYAGSSPPPCFSSLTLNMQNSVSARECADDSAGIKHYLITTRDPELALDPEYGLSTDVDLWGDLDAGTERQLDWQVGPTTANPDVVFSAPRCQLKSLGEQDRNGIAAAAATYGLNGTLTTSDDEVTIYAS